VLRPIARSVFFPVPNVDSVLIVMSRVAPGAPLALRRFVQAAFAHRRKALAGSLALGLGADRERVRELLVAIGHPPDERAERLSPAELRSLWEAL
jgi:16S rRNA (adenine1518-N6/adenine1519-N6)-dimethyltransferase